MGRGRDQFCWELSPAVFCKSWVFDQMCVMIVARSLIVRWFFVYECGERVSNLIKHTVQGTLSEGWKEIQYSTVKHQHLAIKLFGLLEAYSGSRNKTQVNSGLLRRKEWSP